MHARFAPEHPRGATTMTNEERRNRLKNLYLKAEANYPATARSLEDLVTDLDEELKGPALFNDMRILYEDTCRALARMA